MNNLDFLHHLAVIHWHLENLQTLPQFQANEQLQMAFQQFQQAIQSEVKTHG